MRRFSERTYGSNSWPIGPYFLQPLEKEGLFLHGSTLEKKARPPFFLCAELI